MSSPGKSCLIINQSGMTLIELIIVLAIIAILITIAVPGYQTYMLRVHRGEAVRTLLQTAMCQERIHARSGSYDTGLCLSTVEQKRYKYTYTILNTREQTYTAIAIPQGAQQADPCGSLFLDQSGLKNISVTSEDVTGCWNGR